ncbi:MAG: hypothetical protein ACOX7D_02510 [Alphaproteobacteria bacterium]|jgi:hypothetical protein|nr:hypothetical protein [Alphaproteobacteria bacterium]
MDFPANYDTRMFPETRYLSMARLFAILSAILFLLIIGLSGILVWTIRSSKTEPVLISISADGADWNAIVGNNASLKYSASRIMQESVVENFTKNWFRISKDANENEENWCKCELAKCWNNELAPARCNICCASGANLFTSFLEVVNNDFQARAKSGQEWFIIPNSIHIVPFGAVSEAGGLWRLTARVSISNHQARKIEVFVRTAKSKDGYPATLGYYVADFHAYPAE